MRTNYLSNEETSARGKRIQEIVTALVEAKGPVPRDKLVATASDATWAHKLFASLIAAGVVTPTNLGPPGNRKAYAISNWRVAAEIIDGKDPLALWQRWIVRPPKRKLANDAAPEAPTVRLLTTTEAAATAPVSALSSRALAALKVLWSEGVL